jgi:serine/threonine-protein kinase
VSVDARLPALFATASELPPEARAAWLAELETDEPALARELGELLAAAADRDELLDRRPLAFGSAPVPLLPPRVGPYRVLREVGRGGMGRVFLADQQGDGFERTVALKLLDSTAATPQALRRFASEVRILATLEHPGIARFLDGGHSPEGIAYLALEYVEGVDLLAHADRNALDLEARLRLFLEVLDAVAYAHARRVVHRDLKPNNVLVGRDGRPRLLDFGISKLMDVDADGLPTRTEMRALTPAYASPEQMRGDPVTAASDLYSLGVVLYELLTGSRPYRTASGAPRELERAVLEQDPEPPSTAARRARRLEDSGAATRASTSSVTRPPSLRIDADLDAICLKALRKEPAARYASAADFAADLRRFLAGEPVAARRGGWSYRAGRRLRRSRGRVAAAAAVAAALAAGIAAGPWLRETAPGRAEDALAQVVAETPMPRASRRALEAALERLRALDPAAARGSLRELLAVDASSPLGWDLLAQAETQLGESARAAAAARRASSLAGGLPAQERARLLARADATGGRWDAAVEGLEALLAQEPERLDVALDLVAAHTAAGRTEAALIVLGRVRQLAAAADDPRVDLAETEAALQGGEHQRAAALADRARRRALPLGGKVLAARARLLRGLALRHLDQDAAATRELRGARAEAARLGLRRDAAAAGLALASVAGGRPQTAETRQEVEAALATFRAVGDGRGEVAALCELAAQLAMEGEMGRARRAVDEAVERAQARGDGWALGSALAIRMVIANWAGDDAAVVADVQPTLRALRASGNRKVLLTTLGNVSILLIDRLELAEVDGLLDEAEELARRVGSQLQRVSVLSARGLVAQTRGDYARARTSFAAVVELERASGRDSRLADSLSELAGLEVAADRPEEAAAAAEQALAAYRRAGNEIGTNEITGVLAWADARRGDAAGARRRLAAMRAAARAPESASDTASFAWLMAEARVAEALGDLRTARDRRRETVQMAMEWKAPGLILAHRLALARVLTRLRDPEGTALARQVLAEAEGRGLHGMVAEARALLPAESTR